jgi:hypothetical protein
MKLRPARIAAARLALGLALSVCGVNALAQSAPAPAAAAPAAAPAPTAPPAAAEPAKPAAPSALQVTPPAEPLVGAGEERPESSGTTAEVNLPRVNVQGQRNTFYDNDKKLKELKDSLPCAGCDATPHVKKKFVKKVLDAVAERITPTEAPDHSARDPNDKAEDLSRENDCNAGNVGGCVPSNLKP